MQNKSTSFTSANQSQLQLIAAISSSQQDPYKNMPKTFMRVRKPSLSIVLKKAPALAIERITAIIKKTYKAEAKDCKDCRANQAKEQSQTLQVMKVQ